MISLVAAGMIACSSSNEEAEVQELQEHQPTANLPAKGPNYGFVGGDRTSMFSGDASATPAGGVISSMAAEVLEGDTTRKLIRTAELQFRVKNVADATVRIEEITRHHKGFVVRTNLQSQVSHTTTTPLSADSVLESAHYSVSSRIIIRVPAERLDTTLRAFSHLVDFLEYRHINVRDVEMELRANEQKERRYRTAAAPRPRRTTSTQEAADEKIVDGNASTITLNYSAAASTRSDQTNARDQQLQYQIKADEAGLANLSLEDQIRYSTITINIYQRPDIRRTVLADERNIKAYKPGPGSRLRQSLATGWEVLITVLEFLTKLWGLFLMGALAYGGVITYQRFFAKKDK